jgi:uncharacterized membrane protein YagU involved in acid resistance
MSHLLNGALSGFLATIPMTATMELLHRRLPPHEQYPLPPREITENLTEEVGMRDHLDESTHVGLTLLSHFAYGTAAGAVYASLARHYKFPPLSGGVGFGLALWAASYLGWLPAIGLLPPASKHPPRRTGLMLAAHGVWGATLGIFLSQFPPAQSRDSVRRVPYPEDHPAETFVA